ncbi:MAG: response regulator [Clostridiales bacterium]|nr:response regulator [Clostridiales bacterium]
MEYAQTERVYKAINIISDYAIQRGDRFYQDAKESKDNIFSFNLIVVMANFLIVMMIGFYLYTQIRLPLKDLTSVTEQFRKGHYDVRSSYASENEFGLLAGSINSMASTIETEIKCRVNASQLIQNTMEEDDMHAFSRMLLKELLLHTGSEVGAIYLLNEEKTCYEHLESIGLSDSKRLTFSAVELEGEFGQVISSRQICHITEIPTDTEFVFSAVTGIFAPRDIVTIPVLNGKDKAVTAIISLASIRSYKEREIRLLNDIWSTLNARFESILALRRITEIHNKLEIQNKELSFQTKELTMQAEELGYQNIELEVQKRKAEESARIKATFLSNISHELRTPLNSVIALTNVLNNRLKGKIPDKEYGYLDIIERSSKHLLSLIDDILNLSRIEAGREEINLRHFTLGELIGEVDELIAPLAREKGIHFLNNLINPDRDGSSQDDLSYLAITSDYTKCFHILQNFTSNAVKFTDKGKVEIKVFLIDEKIHISVTDTGIGIAEENLSHIFEEFRQVDDSTTRIHGGSGLGLSIANKYASMLYGNITVESILGTGSTFTLILPIHFRNVAIIESQSQPKLEYKADSTFAGVKSPKVVELEGKGRKILLVEDNEPAIIQITDVLLEQGYDVITAHNGEEALEKMHSKIPDAMILDLMMPKIDGFQVLKVIRRDERFSGLPVLILTAKYVTKEEVEFLKGNHIFQLIQKGNINKAKLIDIVASMFITDEADRILAELKGQESLIKNKKGSMEKTSLIIAQDGRRPVVLVIEDNSDNMISIIALLQDTCDIIEATDGQAGVDKAIVFKPDLILMDISLPIIDGFTAFTEIRKIEGLNNTPVIALTAHAMNEKKEEILAHGFNGYISKPIAEDALYKSILEVLYGET